MVRKCKFFFVSTMGHYPWGGSELLWSEAAHWLAKNGHTVSASVRYWPQPRKQIENLSRSGVLIEERKISVRDYVDYGITKLTRSPGKRPPGFSVFKKWIRSQKPDLVCFSDGGFASNPLMMIACYEDKIPYVSIGQANSVGLWPKDDQVEEIRFALSNAKKVFFVSSENLELTEFQVGMRLPHAEVVWNPFNVRYDANPPWPTLRDGTHWKLACVARLETHAKGHDLLFRVLARERWQSRPIEVTLYGAGPNERSLKAMAKLLGQEKRITFAGHVEDIERIWSESHALILPSRYEGLPLALIEAMLCNRMAIVTNVSGNSDVTLDNVTGFLASAPTVQHLDSAMERAWIRREDWQSMGLRAGEHVRRLVPAEPAAEFAMKLFREAINKP